MQVTIGSHGGHMVIINPARCFLSSVYPLIKVGNFQSRHGLSKFTVARNPKDLNIYLPCLVIELDLSLNVCFI